MEIAAQAEITKKMTGRKMDVAEVKAAVRMYSKISPVMHIIGWKRALCGGRMESGSPKLV